MKRRVGSLSRRGETNFNIFRNPIISTSTKVYILNVSTSSVSYFVSYIHKFGASSE
jgi:hypothetical protein